MNRNNVFNLCRQCISNLHKIASEDDSPKFRKTNHITLRYFFVRNKTMLKICQTDEQREIVLMFMFLINRDMAIPLYMYQLLPEYFPFTIPFLPHIRKSTDIGHAFISWYKLTTDYPFTVTISRE